MPIYAYKCQNPACSHEFDEFARVADRHSTRCQKCGAHRCTIVPSAPARPRPDWQGSDAISQELRFDPKHIDRLRRDVPDAELSPSGRMIFKNDAHQKRVYKQMAGAVKRVKERNAEKAAKAQKGTSP